jgi:hypothetical protein
MVLKRVEFCAMPLVVLGVVLQLVLVVHAIRTGRDRIWITVLIFLPGAGSLAYVLMEVIPEWVGGRTGQRAIDRIKTLVNPEARLRALQEQLEIADTVENKQALADEYLAHSRFVEAVALYEETLQGIHKSDPQLMLGLAAAQFGAGGYAACLATLDSLRRQNPGFYSVDGHILYARSLEVSGKHQEAADEYASLISHNTSAEASCRYGLLLRDMGRNEAAEQQLQQVVRYYERGNKLYRDQERKWYMMARENLPPTTE